MFVTVYSKKYYVYSVNNFLAHMSNTVLLQLKLIRSRILVYSIKFTFPIQPSPTHYGFHRSEGGRGLNHWGRGLWADALAQSTWLPRLLSFAFLDPWGCTWFSGLDHPSLTNIIAAGSTGLYMIFCPRLLPLHTGRMWGSMVVYMIFWLWLPPGSTDLPNVLGLIKKNPVNVTVDKDF